MFRERDAGREGGEGGEGKSWRTQLRRPEGTAAAAVRGQPDSWEGGREGVTGLAVGDEKVGDQQSKDPKSKGHDLEIRVPQTCLVCTPTSQIT